MTADKPLLRGVSHQFAVFCAAGAGLVLVAMSQTVHVAVATAVYALSLVAMFAISAAYHRGRWGPRAYMFWKRADHATIFVFIAGTYTPICLLALGGDVGARLLGLVWLGAGLGVMRAVFWPRAPRAVTVGLYVAVGWAAIAYWRDVSAALDVAPRTLIVVGGLLYTAGAAVYALRRPDPAPRVFGYHEIFHALVIVASGCHFAAVVLLARS